MNRRRTLCAYSQASGGFPESTGPLSTVMGSDRLRLAARRSSVRATRRPSNYCIDSSVVMVIIVRPRIRSGAGSEPVEGSLSKEARRRKLVEGSPSKEACRRKPV